ncbi:hypothetical protein APR04_003813 [Promicromonospora umidemergens]|uniref:Holin n=1 Tax=Promicromonospora umidemergens TaxID=629679 RepID=A0ABP8XID5_9MICO|nr:hypothetical protein [Promicromonospora umidemergens]MCP2284890.1 hypothetical protein [Promicromonospora umidemergens]
MTTTQQAHPARAAARTFVQSWLPQIAVGLVLVPLVVGAVTDTAAEYGILLPDWLGLALAGVVTGCAALSALLARLMAIPGVDAFLERFRLGSAPRRVSRSE